MVSEAFGSNTALKHNLMFQQSGIAVVGGLYAGFQQSIELEMAQKP